MCEQLLVQAACVMLGALGAVAFGMTALTALVVFWMVSQWRR